MSWICLGLTWSSEKPGEILSADREGAYGACVVYIDVVSSVDQLALSSECQRSLSQRDRPAIHFNWQWSILKSESWQSDFYQWYWYHQQKEAANFVNKVIIGSWLLKIISKESNQHHTLWAQL